MGWKHQDVKPEYAVYVHTNMYAYFHVYIYTYILVWSFVVHSQSLINIILKRIWFWRLDVKIAGLNPLTAGQFVAICWPWLLSWIMMYIVISLVKIVKGKWSCLNHPNHFTLLSNGNAERKLCGIYSASKWRDLVPFLSHLHTWDTERGFVSFL